MNCYRLWDDGIIDPADTHKILGLCISTSNNRPLETISPSKAIDLKIYMDLPVLACTLIFLFKVFFSSFCFWSSAVMECFGSNDKEALDARMSRLKDQDVGNIGASKSRLAPRVLKNPNVEMESHKAVVKETLWSTNFTSNTSKPTAPLHGSYPLPSEVTSTSSKVDLVLRSLCVSCVPGTANIVALLGVQLKTLGDIDNLTKEIELGKLELWSDLPSENKTEVLETIWAMWDAFLAENPNVSNGYSLDSGKSDPLENRVKGNDPIVKSVDIHEKPRSYIGAAEGSKSEPRRSSFAQCLIEINADNVLPASLTIGVPLIEGEGYTIETVTTEYEWKPPRCDLRKIFGHVHDHCPKKVGSPPTAITSTVVTPTVEKTNDRFQMATTSAPKKGATAEGNTSNSSSMLKTTGFSFKKGNITTSNSYFALDDESEEDVENMYDESANLFPCTNTGGSSSFMVVVG
ncbi:hypothetical protein Tco_0637793 [Tanacetum coccineum]